jgi:hypothetical protein
MSQQPFQDTAVPQCDVVDAAGAGDGGISSDQRVFEGEFSNVTRTAAQARASCAMCDELHNRIGIFMLKSIRPGHDKTFEEADQAAEQGSNSMDDVLNLAQVKAELSYLNRLEERRETNVASLKRLKEARDALLGRGSEVAGGSASRRS